MKHSIFLYFIFLSVIVSGQNANEIFTKMNSVLTSAKPLQYKTHYNLYKDARAKTAYEHYTGEFHKNSSNEIYMKINTTEFLYLKKITLKVDHLQKAIVVTNSKKYSSVEFDINQLLPYCSVKSVKDLKAYWEITLVPTQFSGLTYSSIVLQVNKNYTLKKQEFYYNTGIDFSKQYNKQDIAYPRLEILYSDYKESIGQNAKLNYNVFITLSKADKASASEKYKDYEIIEKRNAKSKKI